MKQKTNISNELDNIVAECCSIYIYVAEAIRLDFGLFVFLNDLIKKKKKKKNNNNVNDFGQRLHMLCWLMKDLVIVLILSQHNETVRNFYICNLELYVYL